MKRILAILLVVILLFALITLFASCAEKGPCELCGKVDSLKIYKANGEQAKLCGTCYDLVKSFGSLF